jgi:hypothetical protein
MKAIKWSSAFFLILSPFVKGQEYIPFPAQDATWTIYLESTCDNDSPPDTMLYRLVLNGDTIINETNYNKLTLQTGSPEDPDIRELGGLREEGKKVFYYGEGILGSSLGGEVLLYDFNAQINDTIDHTSDGFWRSIVLDIDSVQIGSQYRKRYKVDNGWFFHNPDYLIEGIGSVVNGLLGHISDIPTCGTHYWEHVCFIESDQVVHRNLNFSDCDAGLKYNSIGIVSEKRFKIIPNPFTENIRIENLSAESCITVEVYNSLGRLVFEDGNISNCHQIPITYSTGCFIVIIKDSKGTILWQEKMIKE